MRDRHLDYEVNRHDSLDAYEGDLFGKVVVIAFYSLAAVTGLAGLVLLWASR